MLLLVFPPDSRLDCLLSLHEEGSYAKGLCARIAVESHADRIQLLGSQMHCLVVRQDVGVRIGSSTPPRFARPTSLGLKFLRYYAVLVEAYNKGHCSSIP